MRKAGTKFDNEGNFYIPRDISLPGSLNPGLKPREWLLWIFHSAENKGNDFTKWIECLGSRSTRYRTMKRLVEKGYG